MDLRFYLKRGDMDNLIKAKKDAEDCSCGESHDLAATTKLIVFSSEKLIAQVGANAQTLEEVYITRTKPVTPMPITEQIEELKAAGVTISQIIKLKQHYHAFTGRDPEKI